MMWRTGRIVMSAAVMTFVMAIGVGCAHPKTSTQAGSGQMDSIANDIQTALTRRPDVVQARVVYQNNLDAPGMVTASMSIKGATDAQSIVDETLRLVWQSKLNPLSSIHVGVVHADGGQRGTTRDVNLMDRNQKADLERKYGPHPPK